MGQFAAYTFSAGIFLLGAYLAYKWLLSTENQPGFNRIIILAIYAMSFVLPLCHIDARMTPLSTDAMETGLTELASASVITEARTLNASRVLLWIYIFGMVAVAFTTALSIIRLCKLVKSGQKTELDGYVLVTINRSNLSPFSWNHFIVVSNHEDADTMKLIISHERAHIHLGHFYDLLLAQLVCIVLWYNPASWLMLSELKAVHEFQADRTVLDEGIDIHQYQTLLIKKTVGARFQSIANSLNHSNLKKRITMMYKSKTKPVRRFRALAAVPAAALAMVVLNVPSISGAVTELSLTRLSDKVSGFSPDLQVGQHYGQRTQTAESTDAAEEQSTLSTVSEIPLLTATENSKPSLTASKEADSADSPAAEDKTAGDETTEVIPEYPGGMAAMFGALASAVRYPEEAFKAGIQGNVVVGLTIDSEGRMSDVTIIKGVDPQLDAEAIRAVRTLGDVIWSPGMVDGKPVKCTMACPVTFKLKGNS